jgi:pimeloyl-ACP methyl ester carboxylesterase
MTISQSTLSFLPRGEGSIAYEIRGTGPLVLCVPGMGDLRSSYRHLVPALVNAGYRVAVADLRGHGDSDSTFSSYDDEATASDAIALIEHLDQPATIVGNSMGAGAAVIAAARRPELVSGLVLLGPFVRNPPSNVFLSLLFRVLTASPWVAAVWKSYLPSLYRGRKPADFAPYLADVNTAMKRPGHARAFSRTTKTSHEPAELVVGQIRAPVLIAMGALDPDFTDPAAEAAWIAKQTGGETLMLDDCGHYPQSQQPELLIPAITSFLAKFLANGADA